VSDLSPAYLDGGTTLPGEADVAPLRHYATAK
jgi:hypothetical protein